jgi:hypothetical protein
MIPEKPEIKLILFRNDEEIGSIIPRYEKGVNDFELKTNSSIHEYPNALFKSQIQHINELFMTFSKNDLLQIDIRKDEIEAPTILFRGVFFKKNVNYQKEGNSLTIEIEAIHSFFKLSQIYLEGKKIYENVSFYEFLKELMDLADIKSIIYITDDIKRKTIQGQSQNINAFRLLKDICFQKKLSISFNSDDSVTIENAEEKRKKILGQTPIATIKQEDIISSNHREEL